MATPNHMPQRNKLRQQLMHSLIETKPTSWTKKVWNEDDKKVEEVEVKHDGLRWPLAGNVSNENVERVSKQWLK